MHLNATSKAHLFQKHLFFVDHFPTASHQAGQVSCFNSRWHVQHSTHRFGQDGLGQLQHTWRSQGACDAACSPRSWLIGLRNTASMGPMEPKTFPEPQTSQMFFAGTDVSGTGGWTVRDFFL